MRPPRLSSAWTVAALTLAVGVTVAVAPGSQHAGAAGPAPLVGGVLNAGVDEAAYSPRTRVVFSRPGEGRISRLLVRNISAAGPGSVVRGVTWSYSSHRLTSALATASRRGVRIQVVVGGVSCRQPAFRELRRSLVGRSRATCTYRSARGGRTFAGRETQLHQKSWTFSRTGSARWVTVVTSGNATPAADAHQHNDAFQVVGHRRLHDALARAFEQQRRDRVVRRPFRRLDLGDSLAVTLGPWDSPHQHDPVVRRIRDLPARSTAIAVAVSNWSDGRGVRIARALADKLRAGASVRVLTSKPFSSRVRAILRRAGAQLRSAHLGPRRYHHHKFMTARFEAGRVAQTRTWTGSENWWGPSRGHDELVLESADPRAYTAYLRGFDELWDDRRGR